MTPVNIKPVLLLIGILLVDLFAAYGYPQQKVDDYLGESAALAGSTYLTCRVTNGLVSVLKESSVSASPAGIGVQIAIGQILDPLDDATERLSHIAAISLGLTASQLIVFNVLSERLTIPFAVFAAGLLLLSLFSASPARFIGLYRLLVVIFIIRLSIPIMCGLGIWVDEQYISRDINTRIAAIQTAIPDTEVAAATQIHTLPEEGGLLEKIERLMSDSATAVADFHQQFVDLKDQLHALSVSLTDILKLLFAKVLIQVFILPLTTYWAVRETVRYLFRQDKQLERILARTSPPVSQA